MADGPVYLEGEMVADGTYSMHGVPGNLGSRDGDSQGQCVDLDDQQECEYGRQTELDEFRDDIDEEEFQAVLNIRHAATEPW